jgi:hypothetical protein
VEYFAFFGFCYGARHILYGPTSRRQGIRFIVIFFHIILVIKAFLL